MQGGTTLKILIDRDLCEANFECSRNCPDLFGVDEENDKLVLITDHVPTNLIADAENARRLCPKGAISLEVLT